MGRTLDIDMYTDGFSFDKIDCINGPISASAGYYERNYYFYYSFLYGICIQALREQEVKLEKYTTFILQEMGLSLAKIDEIDKTTDEVMEDIKQLIIQGNPVILVVKYNALFYNMYYKDYEHAVDHAIIVNEYIDKNNTFGIRETTLLQDIVKVDGNSNVYFPLRITEQLLKEIWDLSNAQFNQEESQYYLQLYYVKQNKSVEVDRGDMISKACEIFKNWHNTLLDMIDKINEMEISVEDLKYYKMKYCGSLKVIYNFLYQYYEERKIGCEDLAALEKRHLRERDAITSKLYVDRLKKKILSEDKKEKLKKEIIEIDQELIDLMNLLNVGTKEKCQSDEYYIDIQKYNNNIAFASELSDTSVADITGEGTHFIFEDVKINEVWRKGHFAFYYQYQEGANDNIACCGQRILIDDIKASKLLILGCAEYGSYEVDLKVHYKDGEYYIVKAKVSDFYQAPIYKEKLFWSGKAAHRMNNITRLHAFNSRLFAYRYDIPSKEVNYIELPECKNVHIFAITLVNESL
ncbi:hypothetical protein [Cellulosilyticum ruminicola]|uniref:hypothetical protein n=1 Tax=Cellulosilyticum ruminicola TaxID=425254 RepID=UPI0006D23754|nr:hypothetical protein [Cellulosilyticum ruminicola]